MDPVIPCRNIPKSLRYIPLDAGVFLMWIHIPLHYELFLGSHSKTVVESYLVDLYFGQANIHHHSPLLIQPVLKILPIDTYLWPMVWLRSIRQQ